MKKLEGIKAILFDIDNTLIDFMEMKKRSCEAAIDAMISAGLEMKRDKALKVLFELYEKDGIEDQRIFQKFLKEVNGKVDYKLMAHAIVAYKKLRNSFLIPYPHVISTLIELKKKYKLAIVSDAPRIQAWLRIVTMNIDDFFDNVITAADVRKQKTHAAPFKTALRKLGIKPEEALMIGDRIERDVNTAKRLGINTCYARYGAKFWGRKIPRKGTSGADYEINDVKELLNFL